MNFKNNSIFNFKFFTKYGFPLLFTLLLTIIIAGTLVNRPITDLTTLQIRELNDFSATLNQRGPLTLKLPTKIGALAPRTPLTLSKTINLPPDSALYIKTIYVPLQLYINDKLIYSAGQRDSYPDFLLDPPTHIKILSLKNFSGPVTLRFEYLSPQGRNAITLPSYFLGSEHSLLLLFFKENWFPLTISLIFLFIGIILTFLSCLSVSKEPSMRAFLWLGLFALSTGMWGFCECDFAELLLPYPALLYILAFTGLFALPIPLLHFCLLIVDFYNPKPLQFMLLIIKTSLLVALVLQLTGILGFSSTMTVFHILIPLALLVIIGNVFYEHYYLHNEGIAPLLPPVLIVFFFVLLELVNYYLYRFTSFLSMFVQLGVFVFIILLCILGIKFIHNALIARTEALKLENDIKMMERQIELQRKQYLTLAKNSEEIKLQRHDLRHQLTVIKQFNNNGETIELNEYLNTIINNIPQADTLNFCENFAVNAVAGYYAALAQKAQINLTINLAIPDNSEQVQDSDLCIIIGNFLENAIDACKYIPPEERFIKMKSLIQYDTLILTMDNSFDGHYDREGDIFYSRKRTGKGIGLASVEAVANKYNGGVKYEIQNNIFLSSIYIKI